MSNYYRDETTGEPRYRPLPLWFIVLYAAALAWICWLAV